MDDLRHWNFSDHFTAMELASLVVGTDPSADDQSKRVPVLRRITQAYGKAENTMNAAATFGSGLDYWLENLPFDDDALLSEQMLLVVESKTHYGLECYADNCPNFNFAMFTRTEICRWLKAIGLKSAYRFDRGPDALVTAPVAASEVPPATKTAVADQEQATPTTSTTPLNWSINKPPNFKRYSEAVYKYLKSAIDAKTPNRPTASDMVDAWQKMPIAPVIGVEDGIVRYWNSKGITVEIGDTPAKTLENIRKVILRMTTQSSS